MEKEAAAPDAELEVAKITSPARQRAQIPSYSTVCRPGVASTGRHISLLSNFFKVSVNVPDVVFYQYSVSFVSDDKRAVDNKGICRQLMDKVCQTYSLELAGKKIAYDGATCFYTVGSLPQKNYQFQVVLEDTFSKQSGYPGCNGGSDEAGKRSKCYLHARTFQLDISYAAKIPLKSMHLAMSRGERDTVGHDALRVLDTCLRQEACCRGCLLVQQSFSVNNSGNFIDVGGGVSGVRGFHSSFHTTHGGLYLNMDLSTTMILTPGPVIDFLLANQNVLEPRFIDWVKAKKMLKNLRVKTRHRNQECKIRGLSEKPCNQQFFCMKVKGGDNTRDGTESVEITVFEYFSQHCGIQLTSSAYFPCLDVGKPKRPIYLPLELCSLVSLQHYKKSLSTLQRASLVEKSRQKPQERIRILTDGIKNCKYDEDPFLSSCGISIERHLTQVDGRVLEAPNLKVGNSGDCIPHNGRWNFNSKKLLDPACIECWVVVNFSARCDTSYISRELISCGMGKGMRIERPYTLIEEDPQARKGNPFIRVEKMFEQIKAKLPGSPPFILCVLPERKNCDIYGPWKKKCLCEFGIVTQCIAPSKMNDKYFMNLLLKINSKLGGINSLLAIEHASHIPFVMETPTMILGMAVSHGPPSRSDTPSVVGVVGSLFWPLISRYRASVRTQPPKSEMIDALYKPLANGKDDGIMRELLVGFFQTSNGRKPKQIVVFRDGVSESQFNQVLTIELEQIIKAYQHLGEVDVPKFTVIIAQRKHHTKLFQASGSENVPPGTVVDTNIVHPRNYDFYLCSHAGLIGTSRPTHYHVLLDEIGFSPDQLQNFIHCLSYVCQRSTSAISIVAPVCYAHLATQQVVQFVKLTEISETSSDHQGLPVVSPVTFPELPRLHENVSASMFFC